MGAAPVSRIGLIVAAINTACRLRLRGADPPPDCSFRRDAARRQVGRDAQGGPGHERRRRANSSVPRRRIVIYRGEEVRRSRVGIESIHSSSRIDRLRARAGVSHLFIHPGRPLHGGLRQREPSSRSTSVRRQERISRGCSASCGPAHASSRRLRHCSVDGPVERVTWTGGGCLSDRAGEEVNLSSPHDVPRVYAGPVKQLLLAAQTTTAARLPQNASRVGSIRSPRS
jgi:hypothetical protein